MYVYKILHTNLQFAFALRNFLYKADLTPAGEPPTVAPAALQKASAALEKASPALEKAGPALKNAYAAFEKASAAASPLQVVLHENMHLMIIIEQIQT